jgi:putative transposase
VFDERVYLKAYDGVSAARADVADYFSWYNIQRPHSNQERIAPEQGYLNLLPKLAEAA